MGFEPGFATLKVEYVTIEPLQFTHKLFYLVNMYIIDIINGYPEPVVSDPKFTKYLLDREFIYPKDPDPNGSYPNPIRISEVPGLIDIN